MLKTICRLFLGLMVCAGSACVTPTHASSASPILLTVIQASGTAGAKDELVSFYNNSSSEQNITGWCLQNKATVTFGCVGDSLGTSQIILPAFGSAVIVSSEHAAASGESPSRFTTIYAVTNLSSGSIVGSADTLSLLNATGTVVDSYAWTSAHPSGKAWMRTKVGSGQGGYVSTGLPSDWQGGAVTAIPANDIIERIVGSPSEPVEEPPTDNEPNPGDEEGGDGQVGGVIFHPQITELLPNPEGSDAGQEFIEVYNLNESAGLLLDGYALRVGPSLEKSYSFPTGYEVPPLSYVVFTNSDIGFTLVNSTSGVQLQHQGMPAGEVVMYSNPPDGQSWALVGQSWQYTGHPSPGEPNQAALGDDVLSVETGDKGDGIATIAADVANTLKPCAANQYRSLETNRCRLIQVASASTSTPCKEGQVRNAETNRCRNIVSEGAEPAACKVGQERNLDTGRCRNIVKMTDASHAVKGASVQSANTGVSLYAWFAIGGVVLLVVGYAVWEWRHELASALARIRQKFGRKRS